MCTQGSRDFWIFKIFSIYRIFAVIDILNIYMNRYSKLPERDFMLCMMVNYKLRIPYKAGL